MLRTLIITLLIVVPGGLGILAGWALVGRWLARRRREQAEWSRDRHCPGHGCENCPQYDPSQEPERLILSPIDAEVFVRNMLAATTIPTEPFVIKERFEGKGGGSGGAGASGDWATPAEQPEPVVEAGTIDTAPAVEADLSPSEL
jgi:hypothetical protein